MSKEDIDALTKQLSILAQRPDGVLLVSYKAGVFLVKNVDGFNMLAKQIESPDVAYKGGYWEEPKMVLTDTQKATMVELLDKQFK